MAEDLLQYLRETYQIRSSYSPEASVDEKDEDVVDLCNVASDCYKGINQKSNVVVLLVIFCLCVLNSRCSIMQGGLDVQKLIML